ncbi:Elongation of fatty acids protein 2, partial [Cladochytrium tenue]
FIDLCILLGCDYCDSIKGIGPTRAVALIKEHKNIEAILKSLDGKKYEIPEDWPYKEARELFRKPDVQEFAATEQLKWEEPDEEGIVAFMVGEKNFTEERIRSAVKKLSKTRSTSVQGRLADYFKPIAKAADGPKAPAKRKKSENYGKLLETLDEKIQQSEARLAELGQSEKRFAAGWFWYSCSIYAFYLALYFTVWSPVNDELDWWLVKTFVVIAGPVM